MRSARPTSTTTAASACLCCRRRSIARISIASCRFLSKTFHTQSDPLVAAICIAMPPIMRIRSATCERRLPYLRVPRRSQTAQLARGTCRCGGLGRRSRKRFWCTSSLESLIDTAYLESPLRVRPCAAMAAAYWPERVESRRCSAAQLAEVARMSGMLDGHGLTHAVVYRTHMASTTCSPSSTSHWPSARSARRSADTARSPGRGMVRAAESTDRRRINCPVIVVLTIPLRGATWRRFGEFPKGICQVRASPLTS